MKKIFILLILFIILGVGCTNQQYTEIGPQSVSLYFFHGLVTVNPAERKVEMIKIYVDEQLVNKCPDANECEFVASPEFNDTSSYYTVVYFQDKTFAQTKKQTSASFARDVKRIYDLKQYSVAMSYYFDANKTYPAGDGIQLGSDNFTCLNKMGWHKEGCSEPFIGVAPKDLLENMSYIYYGGKENYKIEVNLEGTVDLEEAYGFTGKIEMTPSGLRQK